MNRMITVTTMEGVEKTPYGGFVDCMVCGSYLTDWYEMRYSEEMFIHDPGDEVDRFPEDYLSILSLWMHPSRLENFKTGNTVFLCFPCKGKCMIPITNGSMGAKNASWQDDRTVWILPEYGSRVKSARK